MSGPTRFERIKAATRIVADETGMSLNMIYGHWRFARCVAARHLVWLLVRETWPDISYPKIGLIFGRDHSTVITGVRRARERIRGDYDHLMEYERAKAELQRAFATAGERTDFNPSEERTSDHA